MEYYGCNYYNVDIEFTDPEDANRSECNSLRRKISNLTSNINIYDLYRRCFEAGAVPSENDFETVEIDGEIKKYRTKYTSLDYTPWLYGGDDPAADNPLGPCTFGLPFLKWVNSKEVRDLLHIPSEA